MKPYQGYLILLYYIVLIIIGFLASKYIQFILSLALIYAIVAMGLVILIGYCGLISFGQGAFYAIGAYSVGLIYKYAHIENVEILFTIGIIAGTLISILIGLLCIRTRKIAFAMITLAFTMIIYTILLKFYYITGGTDGLRIPIVKIAGFIPFRGRELPISNEYFFIVTIFVVVLYLTTRIINSPFSYTLRMLRDAEVRAISLGISPSKAYLIAFTYSGFLGSIAGTLYAFLNAHIDPSLAYWTTSGEFVFITILGGISSIGGVILASIIYTFLKAYLIAYTAYYWQFAIGIMLLLIVFLSPKGISLIIDKTSRVFYKFIKLYKKTS
ncbi:MAG: branched-chain amino acid ABC transporter permease [Nitrososphaerota archaeon]